MHDNINKGLRYKRFFIELFIVIAVLCTFGFILFVVTIANVKLFSGSMEDTILKDSRIIGLKSAYWLDEPKRGDVIIFKAPDEPNITYVQRIVGLPGEKFRVENGRIYITPANGGEEYILEEDYLKEEWISSEVYEYEIPEDSYFVMGDNRNDSYDSRYWNDKYVHNDEIIGKAVICYSPKIYMIE